MDNQNYKIKVEYGVATVVLLVGIWFVFQAFTIETSREAVGPRTMPMLLAGALVLSGVWLAVRAFTGRAGDLKEGYGFLESDLRRIFMVVGCGAFFVLLFWAFGYFTALIFTFIATLFTFGVRKWPIMIVGAVILAFAFQAVFMGVMRLNDPKGALVDMRPYTNWITGAK
ncbi:MAG: tripartite tricarboxylate transporter TctB family protein [Rhizobiaceae bacterium]